jgi:hypothetical protein
MSQIKFVICTRHQINGEYGNHYYDTYGRTDGGQQVIDDNCTWLKATFLDKGEAVDAIAKAFVNNEDKFAHNHDKRRGRGFRVY